MSKPNSLRILPDENYLKGESPFSDPLNFEGLMSKSQPRALRSLSQIVDNGLCHRCGSCVGICPTGVLDFDENSYPKVKNLSSCTDCDLCVKVCPGDEFDFHSFHQEKFQENGNPADTHGHFLESVIAHATDPDIRENSTSGGLVTAILLYLLESKQIDGALVIVSDEKEIWKGKPIIARTRAEILSSMKSKYAISPTNSAFKEIREMEGQYALVGLPCQIHGYLKASRLDERLKERVKLTIGIFCHAAVEHEGYRIIWDSVGEYQDKSKKFISRVGKHPGTPYVQLEDGNMRPVYYPDKQGYRPSSMEIINILYRLYSPKRCLTCFDALAEFADISVGDPWLVAPEGVNFLDGWSFALIRDSKAHAIIKQMIEADLIKLEDIPKDEALTCNKMMSSEKVWRSFRVIETLRRQGKAVPKYVDYEMQMPNAGTWQFVKTEINMFTHLFCFIPFRFRAPVLRFFLGNGGYFFLWLNHQRRNLRNYIKKKIMQFRRSANK